MLRKLMAASVVVGSMVGLAAPASAQIPWEEPPLVSPAAPAGFSVFLLRAAGSRLGGLATFRHEAGPVGLGYRLALTEDDPNGTVFAAGVDVSGFLARGVEEADVDVVWWSGGGLSNGNETAVTVPLGLLVGWSGAGGDVIFSPYGGGHVALDIATGGGDNVDFQGAVDLGADIVLSSGWMIRFGATLGESGRDGLALGVKLPS